MTGERPNGATAGDDRVAGGVAADGSNPGTGPEGTVRLTVVDDLRGRGPVRLSVPRGANLRRALLAAGYSPYTRLTERANCGGRGLCATCGVRFVREGKGGDGDEEGESGGDRGESGDDVDAARDTAADPLPTCDPPAPDHWHDRLAARFGYPRLSCQVACDRNLTVRVPRKLVWGGRE